MKRAFSFAAIFLALLLGAAWGYLQTVLAPIPVKTEHIVSPVEIRDKEFYTSSGARFAVKGVALDASVSGSYETWSQWLRNLEAEGVNLIQTDSVRSPGFYHALYDHNQASPSPIYLLHGLEAEFSSLDLYEGLNTFQSDLRDLADLLHGRSVTLRGICRWDVSPWVFGYRLGADWAPDQILYTNDLREAQASYDGTFLSAAENASPFEAFLAQAGDSLLKYEAETYGVRHLLTFGNTPETDPLRHEAWLLDRTANLAQANIEHILSKDSRFPIFFASYEVSPGETFLSYEPPYAGFVDGTGTVNPYLGYETALREFHALPLLISGPAGEIIPWNGPLVPAVTLDGDPAEWEDTPWLLLGSGYGLQARYDESYLYFHILLKDRPVSSPVYLSIDITQDSGAASAPDLGLTFSRNADFLLCLEEDTATLLVQEYYDQLYALRRREIWQEDGFLHPPAKDSASWNPVRSLKTPPLRLADGEYREAVLLPSGELSREDFQVSGDHMELRVPWPLLNVSDAARMLAHGDYYENYGIREQRLSSLDLSLQVPSLSSPLVSPFATLKLKPIQ